MAVPWSNGSAVKGKCHEVMAVPLQSREISVAVPCHRLKAIAVLWHTPPAPWQL